MKVIIVKKPCKGAIIIYPHTDKYGEGISSQGVPRRPYKECKALQKYVDLGYSWFLADSEDLPSKESLDSRRQLYVNDKNKVVVDKKWEVRLMSSDLVKQKHLKKLEQDLNKAVDDPNLNVLEHLKKLSQLQTLSKMKCTCDISSSLQACECGHDTFWSQQALSNLNARVAGGETDKLVVRTLLTQKLGG